MWNFLLVTRLFTKHFPWSDRSLIFCSHSWRNISSNSALLLLFPVCPYQKSSLVYNCLKCQHSIRPHLSVDRHLMNPIYVTYSHDYHVLGLLKFIPVLLFWVVFSLSKLVRGVTTLQYHWTKYYVIIVHHSLTLDFVAFLVFSLWLIYYITTKYNIYLFKTLIPLESGVSFVSWFVCLSASGQLLWLCIVNRCSLIIMFHCQDLLCYCNGGLICVWGTLHVHIHNTQVNISPLSSPIYLYDQFAIF
mgnify:CR=1 FL=1